MDNINSFLTCPQCHHMFEDRVDLCPFCKFTTVGKETAAPPPEAAPVETPVAPEHPVADLAPPAVLVLRGTLPEIEAEVAKLEHPTSG